MPRHDLLTPAEEATLLQGIRSGDERALDKLLSTTVGYLAAVAYSIVDSAQDAEEVVQDVIVDFWNKRGAVELHTGLLPYLTGAVKRRSIVVLRKRASQGGNAAISLSDDEWNTVATDTGTSSVILDIMESVKSLPEKQSEVISYRLSGWSVLEIAQKMAISAKGVEKNITRAVHSLKKILTES